MATFYITIMVIVCAEQWTTAARAQEECVCSELKPGECSTAPHEPDGSCWRDGEGETIDNLEGGRR